MINEKYSKPLILQLFENKYFVFSTILFALLVGAAGLYSELKLNQSRPDALVLKRLDAIAEKQNWILSRIEKLEESVFDKDYVIKKKREEMKYSMDEVEYLRLKVKELESQLLHAKDQETSNNQVNEDASR